MPLNNARKLVKIRGLLSSAVTIAAFYCGLMHSLIFMWRWSICLENLAIPSFLIFHLRLECPPPKLTQLHLPSLLILPPCSYRSDSRTWTASDLAFSSPEFDDLISFLLCLGLGMRATYFLMPFANSEWAASLWLPCSLWQPLMLHRSCAIPGQELSLWSKHQLNG